MTTRSYDVSIATPDGAMPAYLALPESEGPHPGVVVLMEAFGLVPHVRDVARRLAREGYAAVAPDLYYRLPDNKAAYSELPKAIALMQKVDDAKFTLDMSAALDFLASHPEVDGRRLGVTGFCMGGRLAFLSACRLPERIRAAAPFYGGGIGGLLGQADRIRCPLLLFFGELDAFIRQDEVRRIDARLAELGKSHRVVVYPQANHGFFCDERPEYDERSARDAWTQLLDFFGENLR
jgi:carboxymethylenebutenolidase